MTLALRPYQVDAIERIRTAIRQGARRIVVVAPTGAGKTIMFTELIRLALAKGHRVLNLAHRLELIDQISAKLEILGLDHGVIQGSHWRVRPWCPVQVASVPTLSRRERLPEASVINVDECHHTTAPSFAGVIKSYDPDTVVLGWTATPERADGTGLGEHYDQIIEVASVSELIAQGYLVPPRVFAPSTPSVVGVRIVGGDFNKKELSRAVDRPSLVADVVDTWLHRAGPSSAGGLRTTVVFAVSIEHSKHLVDRFVTAGIRAEHLDADTPEDERRAILARVATGETTIVSNVGILTEGWDLPRASCVVQARPTMSRGLYCQMTGRGLRISCSDCGGGDVNACTSPNHKRDCLILDHAGNCHRHRFVTDPRVYSLEGTRAPNRAAIPAVRTCLNCAAVCPSSAVNCTFCDTPFPVKKRVIIERPGKLELAPGQSPLPLADTVPEDRLAKALAKLLVDEREHNYSPARAPLIYKKMFGASVTTEILTKARQIAAARLAPHNSLSQAGA